MSKLTATLAAAAAALIWTASAEAASDPKGIWFDHDKRGAVEIKDCESGGGLCGRVVYIFDAAKSKNCGMQILGNVTPDGGGWIYSPTRKNRYDVRLKRLSDEKLRVVGNANSRFFSRTFTWNRAPDDIIKCGDTTAAAPAKAVEVKTTTTDAQGSDGAGTPTTSSAATTSADTGDKPAAEAVTTTADSSKPEEASEETSEEETSDSGKKCKYHIPYINRTITAPCRR